MHTVFLSQQQKSRKVYTYCIWGSRFSQSLSQFSKSMEKQEAMENFVFPDEIKTKLMQMSKLKNIFYVP